MLKLVIGNKNYSSWSMRPWVLMRQAGIEFEEVKVRFDSFAPESSFKRALARLKVAGKVPVLLDGDLAIWDTLSIAEYLAEQFPSLKLWPTERRARAHARSVCAELHAGFNALRSHCPMNIEAELHAVGALVWRDQAAVRSDVERLCTLWTDLLQSHGGPLLFGEFSIADAFFAPVCMRLHTYGLPVPETISAYMQRVRSLPGVKAWIDEALVEHDFLDFEEPYRLHR